MFLDHATWLAANLGMLGSPTAHRAADTGNTAAATATASFKQRVTSAITWALAIHARDMVLSTDADHSACKVLPWLATLPLSTSSSASSCCVASSDPGCAPVTNPLEWWISVERGDGSLRLLYLRPRALPPPSRLVHRPPAAAIPSHTPILSSPSSNANHLRPSHSPTTLHGSPISCPIRDPSFVSAREPTVCDSGVEANNGTLTCATSFSSHSLASFHSRDRTNDDNCAEWFRNRSSGPSSATTECSFTASVQSSLIVDEFDLPFDEDDDTSSGGSWLDSIPACMLCGNDDCASFNGGNSSPQSNSIPSSPPPIHLSNRRLGFQGSPRCVPLRIDTPPTAVFGFQTPSAPPTPTSAFGPRTCSSSASLLFDQPALSPNVSMPLPSTPSPPLTPKLNVITLGRPDSPPLTCPLPLPEAAISDFARAADEPCRSAPVSPTSSLAGSEAAVMRVGGWSLGLDGSPSVIPTLSPGSILFA